MKHHIAQLLLTPDDRATIEQAQQMLARIVALCDSSPILRRSKIRNLSHGALKLTETVVSTDSGLSRQNVLE